MKIPTPSSRSVLLTLTAATFSLAPALSGQVTPGLEANSAPRWETTAAAGLTLTQGNSDTLLVTANIASARDWDQNEARLGASVTYGETENVRSNEMLQAFGQLNRLLNERLYGYIRLDAMRDAIADVDYRFSLSPGAGYYFIKAARTSLSGELGPGFIYERQGGEESGYFTLRLAERFEHRFNERAKLWQTAEILPQVDDWNNFLVNAELGVETSLTEKLSLRTFVVNTYDNEPAPGRRKNDVKLVTALGYTF
jgi:putative salt-induced outer membrane protein YdiY